MSDHQNKQLTTEKVPSEYISMFEASKLCSYSQEYLSLLARRGKLFAKKMGRNWYTTKTSLNEYLSKQSIVITVPKNIFFSPHDETQQILKSNFGKPAQIFHSKTSAGKPVLIATEGEKKSSPTYEEFLKLNQQSESPEISHQPATKTQLTPDQSVPLAAPIVSPNSVIVQTENQEKILSLLSDLQNQSQVHQKTELTLVEQLQQVADTLRIHGESGLTLEQKELLKRQAHSLPNRIRKYNRFTKLISNTPSHITALVITAIVAIFLLVGGFSFGNADKVLYQIKEALTDADTLQGHFPGTHANEILLLDKAGNVSIYGHIET